MKGADKLLHLKVDIGEPEPRTIVAGIAKAYQAGATDRAKSGDRGEPRATQASRDRIARHDRGGVTARRAAGAGGFPRGHRAGRSLEVRLVDSHTHLDDRRFGDDRDLAVQRALDAGVTRMLSIGTGEGPPDLEAAIRMAERYEPVFASVGLHPEHAPKATQADYDRLAKLLRHPKVLLLGEIGLDYYWKPYDAKLQAEVFVRQMQIASAAREADQYSYSRRLG